MNWRVLAPLAVLGPLMGTLTVMGAFPEGVDRFAWFTVVLASAFVVVRREPARAVAHAAVIGLWNGATSTLVQALFVHRLLANNPWIAARFAKQPQGFDAQFFVFMLVPFIGVAGAGLTALVAMLFGRALRGTRGHGAGGNVP
ncbi:MAG TPA: hypothetical protein VFH88_04030 [Candidatus Krumholzibacteria bacterium]|nr:hypothetical protein [Candidatus Krumholzibacteria bacterium]